MADDTGLNTIPDPESWLEQLQSAGKEWVDSAHEKLHPLRPGNWEEIYSNPLSNNIIAPFAEQVGKFAPHWDWNQYTDEERLVWDAFNHSSKSGILVTDAYSFLRDHTPDWLSGQTEWLAGQALDLSASLGDLDEIYDTVMHSDQDYPQLVMDLHNNRIGQGVGYATVMNHPNATLEEFHQLVMQQVNDIMDHPERYPDMIVTRPYEQIATPNQPDQPIADYSPFATSMAVIHEVKHQGDPVEAAKITGWAVQQSFLEALDNLPSLPTLPDLPESLSFPTLLPDIGLDHVIESVSQWSCGDDTASASPEDEQERPAHSR